MREIYEKTLRRARQRVFDDDRYEAVIQFCKEKLTDYWYDCANIVWHNQNDFITI